MSCPLARSDRSPITTAHWFFLYVHAAERITNTISIPISVGTYILTKYVACVPRYLNFSITPEYRLHSIPELQKQIHQECKGKSDSDCRMTQAHIEGRVTEQQLTQVITLWTNKLNQVEGSAHDLAEPSGAMGRGRGSGC